MSTEPKSLDVTRAAQVWHPVDKAIPHCSMAPNSFGVQVLIWPPLKLDGYSESPVAFYGCRQTNEPNFYLHGRVIDVTHWMPLPKGPRS